MVIVCMVDGYCLSGRSSDGHPMALRRRKQGPSTWGNRGSGHPPTVTVWKLVAVPRYDGSTGSRPEAGPKHLMENSHGRVYRPRCVDERHRGLYSPGWQADLAGEMCFGSAGYSSATAQTCAVSRAGRLRDRSVVGVVLPR